VARELGVGKIYLGRGGTRDELSGLEMRRNYGRSSTLQIDTH
jgi:hypothetical protein